MEKQLHEAIRLGTRSESSMDLFFHLQISLKLEPNQPPSTCVMLLTTRAEWFLMKPGGRFDSTAPEKLGGRPIVSVPTAAGVASGSGAGGAAVGSCHAAGPRLTR